MSHNNMTSLEKLAVSNLENYYSSQDESSLKRSLEEYMHTRVFNLIMALDKNEITEQEARSFFENNTGYENINIQFYNLLFNR